MWVAPIAAAGGGLLSAQFTRNPAWNLYCCEEHLDRVAIRMLTKRTRSIFCIVRLQSSLAAPALLADCTRHPRKVKEKAVLQRAARPTKHDGLEPGGPASAHDAVPGGWTCPRSS